MLGVTLNFIVKPKQCEFVSLGFNENPFFFKKKKNKQLKEKQQQQKSSTCPFHLHSQATGLKR